MLQHCSEVECLCIDLADRENREIFHMFISRTPRNKQPSLGLSVLPTQGPASAGYKNPSVSRWGSIIVAKAHSLKDSYSAQSVFVLLSALFIHQISTRRSEEALHHLYFAGSNETLLRNLWPASHMIPSIYIFKYGDQYNQLEYMPNIFHFSGLFLWYYRSNTNLTLPITDWARYPIFDCRYYLSIRFLEN